MTREKLSAWWSSYSVDLAIMVLIESIAVSQVKVKIQGVLNDPAFAVNSWMVRQKSLQPLGC